MGLFRQLSLKLRNPLGELGDAMRSTLSSISFVHSTVPFGSCRLRSASAFPTFIHPVWESGMRSLSRGFRPSARRLSSPLICSRPHASSSKAGSEMTEEVQKYWEKWLERVDKPTAMQLLKYIDVAEPLGLGSRAASKPPIYSYFLKVKTDPRYADKVALVRVGEFYEAVGIDAVMLVQYAGLNPMGKGNPPRAGCPVANVRRTVNDLVNAGLKVVVCEEVKDVYSYGSIRRGTKERYVRCVVSEASPHFLHSQDDADTDVVIDSAPPLLGIAARVGGYDVIEVDAYLQTVRVTEGLSEDAVFARLHKGGLSPPLYLHTSAAGKSTDTRHQESTVEKEWELRVAAVFRTDVGAVQRYDDPSPVRGMVSRVKLQLDMKESAEFRELPPATSTTRPRPLYYSTAENLGLHKTRGLPSLLDAAMPSGAPLAARRWLRRLLLLPPPPAVGAAIHSACESLQKLQSPFPAFPVIPPANVVLKLRSEEANDTFFRELAELCRTVGSACSNDALFEFSESLMVAVTADTGVHMDLKMLSAACFSVLTEIHDVVDHEEEVGTGTEIEAYIDGGSDGDKLPSSASPRKGAYVAPLEAVLLRFWGSNEDFRGKIRPDKMSSVYKEVEDKRQRVESEVNRALAAAKQGATKKGELSPAVVFDQTNNAIWVRLGRGSKTDAASGTTGAGKVRLQHPRDRNGRTESSAYSTEELEEALDEYRRGCVKARDAVRLELKLLAQRLQPEMGALVGVATFAVVAVALETHIREAFRRGWSLPVLNFSSQVERAPLRIEGMWPYWMGEAGGMDTKMVKNSVCMEGMFLLTGPNMAGKSTFLRSTAAVALLAACGLAVPAAPSTSVPYIDAFMLRNFSSDSPLEGRSSFAVEMTEMRYVLADATSNSLVLVDELGKGTEARAGAALAGAMLEQLDRAGCLGAFATHLHALLDLDLRIPGTTRMMMEIEEVEGGEESWNWGKQRGRKRMRPTWKVVPGSSVESLALQVAAKEGLPEAVVSRAAELYEKMKAAQRGDRGVDGDGGRDADLVVDGVHREGEGAAAPAFQDSSTSSSPPPMRPTLAQAGKVLEETARAVLDALSNREAGSPIDESLAGDQQQQQLLVSMVHYVRADEGRPPPSTTGASYVYVARRTDGWLYVGSSDQLYDRVKQHRQPSSRGKVADPKAEFAYVKVEVGGASAAKTVESKVILAMKRAGFGLLSDVDARKRHAPARTNIA